MSEAGAAFFRRFGDQLKLVTKQAVDDVEKIEKSTDEWRALGVKYAIYSESERDPQFWMAKALACFKRSGDNALVLKAEVHLESIRLRTSDGSKPDLKHIALLLLRLVTEGLMLETRQLVEQMLPFLDDYNRDKLIRSFLPLLPLMEE